VVTPAHELVGRSTRATQADDWAAAIAEAEAELGSAAVELMASRDDRLASLLVFLASRPAALDRFGYVSVHAPMRSASWTDVCARLAELPPRVQTIVVHPQPEVERTLLRSLGARIAIENMDVTKPGGRTAEELRSLFAALPGAGFCLDVAHVWTNDSSLALGHDLLDAFGGRLRQLHVSGIEADGTHRPTTEDDLQRYAPLLERCRNVPWIFEEPLA
jgi:sugar phosphate isomerase/epimerase